MRPRQRQRLNTAERAAIAAKTDGRCHICGGVLGTTWHIDHVRAHSAGGTDATDNCLAAHSTCNTYRWDYLPEECQWTLKIGVWARIIMEKQGARASDDVRICSLPAHPRAASAREVTSLCCRLLDAFTPAETPPPVPGPVQGAPGRRSPRPSGRWCAPISRHRGGTGCRPYPSGA